MQKYGHIGTFWIEKYGPHIAILVFSALARLNLGAALAAFSAAGCAFEGQGMARIGGPPATSESVIILPAGSGDASQSRRPRLRRRKASRMWDMLTWGPVKLHPTVFRHHGKP